MKVVAAASLIGSVAAFAPASTSTGRIATTLSAEKSQAIPFLPAPANCEGYVGNVGFDPLGVSNYFPIEYLREAELKHGRICQLAWLGYVAVDLGWRIPGYPEAMSECSSATAHDAAVEFGAMGNVSIGAVLCEYELIQPNKLLVKDLCLDCYC